MSFPFSHMLSTALLASVLLHVFAKCFRLRQLLKLCRDLEGKGPLKARVNFGPFFTSSLAVVHGPGNYSFKIAGFLSLSISLYMTVPVNIASFAFTFQFIVINQHPFIFT